MKFRQRRFESVHALLDRLDGNGVGETDALRHLKGCAGNDCDVCLTEHVVAEVERIADQLSVCVFFQ